MNEDQLYSIIGRLTTDLLGLQARVRHLETELAAAKVAPPKPPPPEDAQ